MAAFNDLNHTVLLKSEKLRIGYGSYSLLPPIDIEILGGEMHLLMGPNGVGKTTFLKTVAGLRPALSGNLIIQKCKTFLLSATPSLFLNQSVLNNVEFLCNSIGETPSLSSIKAVLKNYDLVKKMSIQARYLSSGQKRRLTLAAIDLSNPQLVLADEPTNGLDKKGLDLFSDLAIKIMKYGGSLIIATHDNDLLKKQNVTLHTFIEKKGF